VRSQRPSFAYSDQRDYTAIAISSPIVSDFEGVRDLFPDKSIGVVEELPTMASRPPIRRCEYFSEDQFSTAADAPKPKIRGGRKVYEYSLYAIMSNINDQPMWLLGVPFARMAASVFKIVRDRGRGHGLRYISVGLEQLIESLSGEEPASTDLLITGAEFSVRGDSPAERVVLTGTDILHSETYSFLRQSDLPRNQRLSEQATKVHSESPTEGIGYVAQRCRVAFNDHGGGRFNFIADQQGVFRFRILSGARNLKYVHPVLEFLNTNQLITPTTIYPLRIREDEDAFALQNQE